MSFASEAPGFIAFRLFLFFFKYNLCPFFSRVSGSLKTVRFFFSGAAIWHPRCGPGPGAELINPRSGPDSLPNGHLPDEEYSGPEMDGVDGLSSISDTQVLPVSNYLPYIKLKQTKIR